jgi:hypothetical protein
MTPRFAAAALLILFAAACGRQASSPTGPSSGVSSAAAGQDAPSWGPETPNFNLEIILRAPEGSGFGHVKVRQPNDDQFTIYLDTWVRDLKPNTSYLLERAVDTTLDGTCSSTAWLILGKGLQPQAITTDATGTGREDLFRTLVGVPAGTTFDIHFRVVEQETSAVALESGCYQFTVSE